MVARQTTGVRPIEPPILRVGVNQNCYWFTAFVCLTTDNRRKAFWAPYDALLQLIVLSRVGLDARRP